MDKIVVHTLQITKAKEKQLFELMLPEDVSLLTGIEISSSRHGFFIPPRRFANRAVGIIRLFVADDGDCIFSEMLRGDQSIPSWEAMGEFIPPTPWNQKEPLPPFLTKQFTKATVINGFYEDMVGEVGYASPDYTVTITLYYQT